MYMTWKSCFCIWSCDFHVQRAMYRMSLVKFKILNFVQKNVSRPLQLINRQDYIVNPLHKVSKTHSVSFYLIVSEANLLFRGNRLLPATAKMLLSAYRNSLQWASIAVTMSLAYSKNRREPTIKTWWNPTDDNYPELEGWRWHHLSPQIALCLLNKTWTNKLHCLIFLRH